MSSIAFAENPEPRADGLHRVIHDGWVPDLLELVEGFRDIEPDYYPSNVAKALDEARSALRQLVSGGWRPCDEILDDWLLHSNIDEWIARTRGHPGARRNRLMVDATMTTKGNLSVRFTPVYLDAEGELREAREWNLPHLGRAAIMERPNDELLFVRRVDEILHRRLAHGGFPQSRTPQREAMVDLSCRLVNATFWSVVHRLANRFEVTVRAHVAMLCTDPFGQGEVVGLEIVNDLKGASRDVPLDPAYIRDIMERMQAPAVEFLREKAPHLFTPILPSEKKGEVMGAPNESVHAPVAHTSIQAGAGGGDPPAGGLQEDHKKQVHKKPPPARAGVGRPINEERPAVRYPSHAMSLTDAEKAEFGVQTAHELVAMLNEAWTARGLRPLAPGSYPTNKRWLRFVVVELRKAKT